MMKTALILFLGFTLPATAGKPTLIKPVGKLFSHKAHFSGLKGAGVTCTDCHSFSKKSGEKDPLAVGVGVGHLKAQQKICHQCHLEKVTVPGTNQCVLCHRNTRELMPKSHLQNWKARHGRIAMADPESCRECHTENTCTACHVQRDNLKPSVHRPNFRVLHSMDARANPQSCVTCHSTSSTCVNCHTKGIQ